MPVSEILYRKGAWQDEPGGLRFHLTRLAEATAKERGLLTGGLAFWSVPEAFAIFNSADEKRLQIEELGWCIHISIRAYLAEAFLFRFKDGHRTITPMLNYIIDELQDPANDIVQALLDQAKGIAEQEVRQAREAAARQLDLERRRQEAEQDPRNIEPVES